ncbi:MAG: DNA-directed RNA polymerase subunit beta', partial [Chryseobacterium sp.]
TQLTLRTFHQGGTAGNISENPSIVAKREGIVEMDEVRTIKSEDEEGNVADVVVSRTTEFRLVADTPQRTPIMVANIPYGSALFVKSGDRVNKGDLIAKWDPYNAVIIAESAGKVEYEDIIQGVSYQLEIDEQTGFEEKVISESRNKKAIPTLRVVDADGVEQKSYNLPVGAHLMVNDGQKIRAGKVLIKIPRKSAKAGDITGGLPRVTELFEARNPSNPAVVTEIDGVVSYGKIKRGNRELIVEARTGEIKKYLVKLSNQILVQENDFVYAGSPLSDGSVTPEDILRIKGPTAVQEYLVNEIQEVYRLQGVKIDDKHFEIIVRQMMTKVEIVDGGDTQFLEGSLEHKNDFIEENERIFNLKVVVEPGDSKEFKAGQMITARELRDENSKLKREDMALVEVRDALPATARPVLQGITRAALQTKSFMSAASFQETTKVLNEAAVSGKVDELNGLKENVIVGHRIPAGTGLKEYQNIIVGSKREFEDLN